MRRDDLTGLREQRIDVLHSAQQLNDRAKRERRNLTHDEQKAWDESMREAQRLNVEIEAGAEELRAAQPSNGSAPTYRSGSRLDGQIETAIREIEKGESRSLTTAASVSPGELSSDLFDRLRARSVVLSSGIKTLETEADSVVFPRLVSDVAPSWTSEAQAITPSDPGFDQVTAVPRKAASLTQLSNELVSDSAPSIIDTLNTHLFSVLSLKLDAGILQGSGTPPEPTGLLNVAGKTTIAAGANGATPTLDHFADGIAALEAANVPRERIRAVAHPRNVGALRKLKASTGGTYLWSSDPSATSPSSIFGVPVYTSAQLSTTEVQGTSGAVTNSIYLYDIESVCLVWRSPIEVTVDRSRLFHQDMSEVRATLRADLVVPNALGVVRISGLLA